MREQGDKQSDSTEAVATWRGDVAVRILLGTAVMGLLGRAAAGFGPTRRLL